METIQQNFSTFSPIVEQKIALNNKHKKLYETQIEGLVLQKESLDMDISACNNRIKALNLVNKLENMQLENFTMDRQNDINRMTDDANEMNNEDYKNRHSISKELDVISKKVYELIIEIEKLKKEIPETVSGEKYKVTLQIPTDKCGGI